MPVSKRAFAKFATKTLVSYSSAGIIAKTLLAAIPATENYNIAKIAGALGGWYTAEKLEPYTNELVDEIADTYVKKQKNKKNLKK